MVGLMSYRAVVMIVLGLVIASALAASCGDGGNEPASGEVVLYTSMPDDVVDRLKGVIEQRFPDLDGSSGWVRWTAKESN